MEDTRNIEIVRLIGGVFLTMTRSYSNLGKIEMITSSEEIWFEHYGTISARLNRDYLKKLEDVHIVAIVIDLIKQLNK